MPTPDDKLDRLTVMVTDMRIDMATFVADIRAVHDRGNQHGARLDKLETYASSSPSRQDLGERLSTVELAVDGLKAFMWKTLGGVMVLVAVGSFVADRIWR